MIQHLDIPGQGAGGQAATRSCDRPNSIYRNRDRPNSCAVRERKYGTPVSGWQQQLASRIGVIGPCAVSSRPRAAQAARLTGSEETVTIQGKALKMH